MLQTDILERSGGGGSVITKGVSDDGISHSYCFQGVLAAMKGHLSQERQTDKHITDRSADRGNMLMS